jgi:hypothetical protein
VGTLSFILYLRFLAKFFEKNRLRAAIHGSKADGPKLTSNHTEPCAAQEVWADGPQPTRGQFAKSLRTVHPVQQATLIAADFVFLSLEFKRRQSARYAFFT